MAERDQRSKRFGTPYERRVAGGERIALGDITEGSLEEVRLREENAANIEAGNANSEDVEANDNNADESDAEQPVPTATATIAANEHRPTTPRTIGALPHRPLPRRTSNPASITGTPNRTATAPGSATKRTPTGPSPLLRQALTAASAPPASTSSQTLFDSLSAQLSNPIGLGRPQSTNAPINFANPFTSSARRPRSHSTFASAGHQTTFSAGRNRRLDGTAEENTSPTAHLRGQGTQNKRRRTQSSPMSPGRQAMQQEVDEGEEDFQENESMENWRQKRKDRVRREDESEDDVDDEDDENDENDENVDSAMS
ncbi:uncharacterized protein MYCFIDRAFT_80854 [Pseudocercospora fijiensis CIRAD86]|uniref:Uncharacterized protein n=1 Tax=Pseudocercospora fijiensis (strain CIRAD86) TaxID=383855 RepID=M3AMT2_PSEFD|nr:uncharacterized protein MYCFIDRAFT_80854 [Pseudocercospora fijiensis CIRAD86]EME78438.1 hypothetical protein MYCFIDRAFT_80854 [Pseudocercospora fijiensis CIRAD86]